MKLNKWISYKEADQHEPSIGGWGGWFNAEERGMRWKDFIEEIDEDEREYYEAIRSSAIEKKLRFTGYDHQWNEHGIPLFDDGTVGRFTFRAWGDSMAAIWSEEEDKDYTYMDFYT